MGWFKNIKQNIKKGFTLVEILFAVSLTAAATVSIGAILVSTQNNTTKMFTQGELQQQTAEFQESFRNELLHTNFGMRYWVRQDESSPFVETLMHSGDCYEKIVACYSFDRVDYKLVKTYYKFNSEKGMIETAVLKSDMKDYKEFDNDIIIKIDGDINRTLSKIPNWTVKATEVKRFNVDLSEYASNGLVEYSMLFEDDDETYPTNDAVHLRSEININNDLTVESSKQHIAIPKPYIQGDSIFLYDGYRKQPNVVNVDPRLILKNEENLYGTDPGLYTITFGLPAEEGFMWEDGSEGDYSLQWYITSSAGETTFGEEAYVIWTASDKTLRFYKNSDHPTENNEYNGKMVTKKWTNIEEINATRPGGVPWVSMLYTQVEHVEVVDEICPQSTAFWFYNLKKCKTVDIEKINGELITSTKSMFENCGSEAGEQVELDLSHWDASNTFDMSRMFYNAFPNSLETIYTPVNIPSNSMISTITGIPWYSLSTGETFGAGTFPRGRDFSHFLTSIDPTADYTLKHWQQNVNGNAGSEDPANYTCVMTETHTAFSRMNIYPPAQTFIGFGQTHQYEQPFVIQKDGSTVINYYYPRLSYNVTTQPGYGVDSTSGDGTYLFGATVDLNATMKPGYAWKNWTGFDTSDIKNYSFELTEFDRHYVANGSIITYNITYNLNNGTAASGNPATYNVESAPIVLKNPTRTGYTFAGWTGSNGTTPNTNVTIQTGTVGNLSYTANWTPNNYTYNVKYESTTGVSLGTTTVTYKYDTTNVITCPDKTGYTKPASQTISWDSVSPKTITFKYTPITYTITYNLDGGTISGQKVNYTIETANFTLPKPTKAKYDFTGWTGSNGSTKQVTVTIAKGSTGNKTYTATWKISHVHSGSPGLTYANGCYTKAVYSHTNRKKKTWHGCSCGSSWPCRRPNEQTQYPHGEVYKDYYVNEDVYIYHLNCGYQ